MVDESMGTKRRRPFRQFNYRGKTLENLLEMSTPDFVKMLPSRKRRRFARGMKQEYSNLLEKVAAARARTEEGMKPPVVKTHLRNGIVVPDMFGSVIAVYNGKHFAEVEIKPEMVGHYLGEFSLCYRPVKHGKAGQAGAAKYIPF